MIDHINLRDLAKKIVRLTGVTNARVNINCGDSEQRIIITCSSQK